MTMHLFGTILTPQAVASNNRGEISGGTVATLQKIIRGGDFFSTVSSEAVRYALREGFQSMPDIKMNREVGHAGTSEGSSDSTWNAREFGAGENYDEKAYFDDDVLGYMNANARQTRRGILEIGRAVSIDAWPGTISSQFATPGSNPIDKPNDKSKRFEPHPYQCEVHDTRYQYTFAMTPKSLLADRYNRTAKTLEALQNLRRVGGCHSRFFYDFAPEAIVLRWSTDPAPRIMFCFDQDERGRVSLKTLLKRIQGGDVLGDEVYVGTAIDGIVEMEALKTAGVHVLPGVKAAVTALLAEAKTTIQ
jgi:CRISPR-associated protein Cst2